MILGLTSVDISLISATASIISLYVAVRVAWITKFSPPALAGAFPYAIVWTFPGATTGNSCDRHLVPFFWLTNTGARPMLVADMRLIVSPMDKKPITLFPIHSVPGEAIESPNTLSDYGLLRSGDAPFGGFSITTAERWTANYAFELSPEHFASLKGPVQLSVEIKKVGAKRFKQVLRQNLNFDSPSFDWLNWAGVGGPSAGYYYSDELSDR